MGQMAKSRTCTPFFSKGRTAVHRLTLQMVNPSGVLLKVALHSPRIISTVIHMNRLIHLALVLPCTMVVEIIFMAALHPSKPQNLLIIRWTTRTPPQILMVTGGKVHFTTKQIWWALPMVDKELKGRGEAGRLDCGLVGSTGYLHHSGVTFVRRWWQYLDASPHLGRCSVSLPFSSIVCALDVKCNELT